MTGLAFFVISASLLLIAPGPTNMLLAFSGATVGVRRSLHLLTAAVLGYLVVAVLVGEIAGPLLLERPVVRRVIEIGAAVFLVGVAIRLWRAQPKNVGAPVTFVQLWLTTVLNPKATIIALVLLQPIDSQSLIGLVALAGLTTTTGFAWLAVGALANQFTGRSVMRLGPRLTSLCLMAFAAVLAVSPLLTGTT